MSLPLAHITVIDMTQALAGPYAAMLLGDMGADVVKVERPGAGDQSRGWGPPFLEGESAYYLATNRNKRGLTLDYGKPAGLAILHDLLFTADVLLTNMPRPESMRKAGLDWETLHTRYPRLIACNISGFGMDGPYAGQRAYDLLTQAMSGTMSLTGAPDGEPYRFPAPMSDISAGLYATIGILGALVGRHASGEGDFVDISLLEAQASWLVNIAGNYFATGKRPARQGNQHPNIVPYQPFRARDKYFVITVGTDAQFAELCRILEREGDLACDPRFTTNAGRNQHRDALAAALSEQFATQDAGEWLGLLKAADIPCAPINYVDEVMADPHIQARRYVVEIEHPSIGPIRSLANPVRYAGSPVEYRMHPPRLGEHTDAILAGLGKTPAEIEGLRLAGVV